MDLAPRRDLTIFLLKPDFKGPTDVLPDLARLKPFTITATSGASVVGQLFVRSPRGHAPKWAEFFEGHLDITELGRVASTAAVLLVKTRGRLLALTFGSGRFLLAADCWEERFGLRVALNSIDPDKIRSLDKRTFDALSTQSRIQASREGAAPDFGLDVEQDLVRAVTGTPNESALGQRLSGMDSLHSVVRVDVIDIKPLLRSYLDKYNDDAYKKHFPWIDQIAEVSSKTLVARLDASLVAAVNGSRDKCWLCVPQIIDWSRTAGFRYGFGIRDPEYQDLSFDDFLDSLSGSSVDLELLHRRRVRQVDGDGATLEAWQIYQCIYYECELNGHTYVLSSGRWYRVDVDFVSAVNEFFDRLSRYASPLPEYNDASEAAYCSRVSTTSPQSYALMDRKLIRIGGAHGSIEFCDLFTPDKTLLHVKRYAASSVLSHLFSQGAVSGEAFRADPTFRAAVLEQLPQSFRLFSRDHAPEPAEYQIVFAVVSGKTGPLKLPFVSRVNLRQASRRLEAFGYRAAIAKIQMSDVMAKLKRYGAR